MSDFYLSHRFDLLPAGCYKRCSISTSTNELTQCNTTSSGTLGLQEDAVILDLMNRSGRHLILYA